MIVKDLMRQVGFYLVLTLGGYVGINLIDLAAARFLPGKSSPIFTLRFAPVRPCFTSQKQDRPSLHSTSKRLTLSFALPSFYPLLQRSIKQKCKAE
jgi:hypothetical protein